MPAKPLETDVRFRPGLAIIDLRGDIDGFAKDTLTAAYAHAIQADPTAVLLNFSQVEYINSIGIALIVGLIAQARQSYRRLSAYGLSDHFVEIFRITRLSDFMSIFPDEVSALAKKP